ncbi:isopenicillin N synthase family dioxygenase [Flavobacterium crassostreae]|uniref:Flavonol synthase n=1 Tax=Flavobacterium crassostreae TaxID=1763534 RepID=A0A1B9EA37_9FLAO|nr:2-oxoglutarate and iron-dependent oxygenase domain-containing protein [Flavobacterium crassostreae]OCB78813.1 flavonol synthase [Flavobacterium crassostreae]
MQHIPSVDLRDFLSEDPKRKQKFVTEIKNAFENIGFVALKGHFLEESLQKALYEQIRAFFALPIATKKTYEIAGIAGQRGYVSFGKEHAKGKKEADLKEFWHFGQYLPTNSKYASEYPENVTVKELPNFNSVGQKTYQMLEKTGVYVLRALALGLELDEFYFDQYLTQGNSILRPIHYPPITSEPANAIRAAAHADINLITLLMGAQGKGLQVQNHNNQWIDAIAQPEELVINVGDMLSRLTNNKLKSTLHQVVNPAKELWATSRYSVPFFMHPVSDMPLDSLANCIDAKHPKEFENTTAGAYLQERLIELGLLKK